MEDKIRETSQSTEHFTDNEQDKLLTVWNVTATDYPDKQCIHQLFEAQVQRSPDHIAVIYQNEQLTYRELNWLANQLGHYLQTLGVGPEVLVGICVERSLEMIVGLLGILKAGGAYIPLDPGYPAQRLSFILQDTKVSILLTQEQLRPKLPKCEARLISLDVGWQETDQHSSANVISGARPENLAYVIYTSGSTGKPKGSLISHRSLVNHCSAFIAQFDLQPEDRILQFASISFDASAEEIFPSLLTGSTLILQPEKIIDFLHFSSFLTRERLTILNLPTAYWHLWVTQLNHQTPLIPPSLRLVIVGGEKVSAEHFMDWSTSISDTIRWANTYGPTETTITATIYESSSSRKALEEGCIPIGRPISNVQVYVLDTQLQPVPIGVTGELYIAGVGLARGYLNHPELTAERFIPNPFSNEPGGRLYKTGDLVRYLADGNLEFVGRVDHQVKLRGFRIELGEIETLLVRYPGVREAVVIVREDVPDDKRLVAYLLADPALATSEKLLRSYLLEQLPSYMIPAAFVFLEAYPLTPGGKVDRRVLLVFNEHSPEKTEVSTIFRTPIEELIVLIWMKVLGLKQLSIQDNFFELGGHSLSALQIISRVREAFQVDVPLRYLFDMPTVADLTMYVEIALKKGLQLQNLAKLSREHSSFLPLSFAQQQMWLLDQLVPNNPAYAVPIAVQLVGRLDVVILEQSLNEVVKRHEALRTNFTVINEQPVQVVDPSSQIQLTRLDLGVLSDAEQRAEIQQLISQEVQRPFDLRCDPLIRALLFQLNGEKHVLFINMHHIISDGWSVGVLLHELTVLYQAYSQGQSSPLQELPIQYADFAVWQRQQLQGEILENKLTYWKSQLKGVPSLLQLPTDRPRPSVQTFHGASFPFTLSKTLLQALKPLSQQSGATLFMVLLAAFQVLLWHYTGQDDIVVGTPVANRVLSETEPLIGFFVNTLVLRTNLSGNPTFAELLRRVREIALGAYVHQDLPFEKLVEELRPERDLSYNPLFQVMLVLQNAPTENIELQGIQLSTIEVKGETAQFDMTFDLTEMFEGISGSIEYNTDLFDTTTVARMAIHWQTLLEGVVRNPDRPIGYLPILSEVEQQQILLDWNNTAADYPKLSCVHQLFEKQVRHTPEAIAVVFQDKQLTYLQLNERANQLAHYLQELGVGPEILVGLCMERSIDLVIALLAVLKAGGAYVPLDPNYPKERLTFILEDAQISVLLTQEQLILGLSSCEAIKVSLDAERKVTSQYSSVNLDSGVKPENLAYIIYTSGSTGRPKGVLITHRGICNVAKAQLQTFNVQLGNHILQFSSLNFDASIYEILMALLAGASLHMGTTDVLHPGPALGRFLRDQAITHITLTPSVLKMMTVEDFPKLQIIISAGEVCSDDVVTHWVRYHRFFNAYGPTEATIWVSVIECSIDNSGSTIGRPISNVQVYVLDTQLQPVPIGVTGELYIAGVGLARGYLNHPELTAERFIPNPFSNEPGGRLYKTGDLVRYLADGNLEFVGRVDHQVKLRGFRIELGEIETLLVRYPGVREAVVIVREDVPDDKRLVAYLLADPALATSEKLLRSYLLEQLPSYMIPAAFVFLEALPLTSNGKLDHRLLPKPEHNGAELKNFYTAPRNPIEELLSEIWTEVLNVEQVGIYDNFFELGGHSLLATQVLSRVRDTFQVDIPLRSLFDAPTVAKLAADIVQRLTEILDNDTLTEILTELEQLSEDEVRAMHDTEK